MSTGDRTTILAHVRSVLEAARREAPEARTSERRSWADPSWEPAFGERAAAFRSRLESVGGRVWQANEPEDVSLLLREILDGIEPQRIAVSDAPEAVALVQGYTHTRPRIGVVPWSAGRAALMEADVGVTLAQHGIAETGTLILDSGAERNRLASLVPAVHVALLPAAAILGTLGEALVAIRDESGAARSRTLTFITGPSRTADIELTLVVGVHGPKELHVILTPENSH